MLDSRFPLVRFLSWSVLLSVAHMLDGQHLPTKHWSPLFSRVHIGEYRQPLRYITSLEAEQHTSPLWKKYPLTFPELLSKATPLSKNTGNSLGEEGSGVLSWTRRNPFYEPFSAWKVFNGSETDNDSTVCWQLECTRKLPIHFYYLC